MSKPERWQCIACCGACCRLDPSLREDAIAALSDEQRSTYLAMVGKTAGASTTTPVPVAAGSTRIDLISAGSRTSWQPVRRPADEADALAIACCKQQIRSEDGGRDRVMQRFLRAIRQQP